MSTVVKDAAERLMDQARGVSGFILLEAEQERLCEHVLVRRTDLQLLLATLAHKGLPA